jgi:hypothetical protein
MDSVDEGVAAEVAEAGEASAVVDELVPAAEGVAVEQPLVWKELLGGKELGNDALGIVGDASAAAVGMGDAHEIGVQAHEEALGGESHGWTPRAGRDST